MAFSLLVRQLHKHLRSYIKKKKKIEVEPLPLSSENEHRRIAEVSSQSTTPIVGLLLKSLSYKMLSTYIPDHM